MHAGIANPRWRGKRSRHSRRMRNPQVYVSGKRPMWLLSSSMFPDLLGGGTDWRHGSICRPVVHAAQDLLLLPNRSEHWNCYTVGHAWQTMMTSWHGNVVCASGPWWGETTGHRRIPLTKSQYCGALIFSLSLTGKSDKLISECIYMAVNVSWKLATFAINVDVARCCFYMQIPWL